MPNWCSNYIEVSHENPAKISALAEAMIDGNFCKHVIPTPEELNITAGCLGADDNPEQIALKAAEKSNLEKYGFSNWYDYQVARWGTKWDVDCQGTVNVSDDGRTLTANFDSAWSPPCGVYSEMVKQDYDVTAYYYECGMGFVGKWFNGEDDCYDIGGLDSKTVRDAIGDELDDMWCISENMAEWEEENQEEDDELTEWYEDGVEKKGLDPHK